MCPGYQRILKYSGREDKATINKRPSVTTEWKETSKDELGVA